MQVVVQLPTEAGKKPVVTAAAGSYPLLEDRGREGEKRRWYALAKKTLRIHLTVCLIDGTTREQIPGLLSRAPCI